MAIAIEDVFGVSRKRILSYIERKHVVDKFNSALISQKQIIVYGASKQGKTQLVKNQIKPENSITIQLDPQTELTDIYRSILRQAGIAIKLSYEEGSGRTLSSTIQSKFKAAIAYFGSAEVSTSGKMTDEKKKNTQYEEISFNLALPQDVSELLRKINFKKQIILENYHYLTDKNQRDFATDLRTFQDLNIRFIILGVWRDQNRLLQFNGDLVDRIEEVTVEPWDEKDFIKIANNGSKHLNINISDKITNKCIDCSFNNVGIFQELLLQTCINSGVKCRQKNMTNIDSEIALLKATESKKNSYTTRSIGALETLATGNNVKSPDGKKPYYINYYIVIALLKIGFEGIKGGLPKEKLFKRIHGMHHRANDFKQSILTKALNKISETQNNKKIRPPIISYDKHSRKLRVVDATFYFFLRNANLALIEKEIPNPIDE